MGFKRWEKFKRNPRKKSTKGLKSHLLYSLFVPNIDLDYPILDKAINFTQ